MIKSILIVLVICGISYADDYCFCDEITVKTNYLNISPVKKYHKDKDLEKLLDAQWKAVTSAIPLTPNPIQMRQFQFVRNWPTVQPVQQKQRRESTQSSSVSETRTLYGVINQNFQIDGQVTSGDVSIQNKIIFVK